MFFSVLITFFYHEQAHETTLKSSELRQNEIFLKSRIEELESMESDLKTKIHHKDELMFQKDTQLKQKVRDDFIRL